MHEEFATACRSPPLLLNLPQRETYFLWPPLQFHRFVIPTHHHHRQQEYYCWMYEKMLKLCSSSQKRSFDQNGFSFLISDIFIPSLRLHVDSLIGYPNAAALCGCYFSLVGRSVRSEGAAGDGPRPFFKARVQCPHGPLSDEASAPCTGSDI